MNWKEHQKIETPHFSMELLSNAFHFSASFFVLYSGCFVFGEIRQSKAMNLIN